MEFDSLRFLDLELDSLKLFEAESESDLEIESLSLWDVESLIDLEMESLKLFELDSDAFEFDSLKL